MRDFIKALFVDLLHRIDLVVAEINSIQHHDDIKDRFISQTLMQFQNIRSMLQQSIDNGTLDFDSLSGNNLHLFNEAHREFNAIHSYRYLAIKNYKDPEIFLFRLITQVYAEHRINALPPIVATISNHDYYYWAVPYFEIIALPSGEESSLLNLPDMYHEIGHLLHSMFGGKSCELSSDMVNNHFVKELVRVEDEGLGNHYKNILEEVRYFWSTSWMEEFSCDLVGTYMTGAAYAWTNLKLISTGHGSKKIFEYSDTHPADEARMSIIILMLEKLGLTAEKEEVEKTWQMFLKDTSILKSKEYPMLYPKKILQHIVEEFYQYYQNADLVSYPELLKNGSGSIGEILNKAWECAQRNPPEYFSYETNAIIHLERSYGIIKTNGL